MNTEINMKKPEEVKLTFNERLCNFMLEYGRYINVALCAFGAICAVFGCGGRVNAVGGWLCAGCAWIVACDDRVWIMRWRSIADRATKCLLDTVSGGKAVGMGVCEVKNEKGDDKKDDISDTQNEAIMGIAKCVDEALEYIKQDNYEFTVSYGSVEIVMNGCPIKEAESEPVGDGHDSNDASDELANKA